MLYFRHKKQIKHESCNIPFCSEKLSITQGPLSLPAKIPLQFGPGNFVNVLTGEPVAHKETCKHENYKFLISLVLCHAKTASNSSRRISLDFAPGNRFQALKKPAESRVPHYYFLEPKPA